MLRILITIDKPEQDTFPVVLSKLDGDSRWSTVASSAIPHALLTDAETDHTQLAERLGELLIDERIHPELHDLRQSSTGSLSLMLHLRDPALATLPWESMRFGARHLFTDTTRPWSRTHAPEQAAARQRQPDDVWPILRMLVVVGMDPGGGKGARASEELQQIKAALVRLSGFVDLDVLERPGPDRLHERCRERQPHILHFIGHGRVEPDGKTVLEIDEGDDCGTWDWDADQIGFDLQSCPPRLVFLNACCTDATRRDHGAWQLVDALAELNVPAILTMRGEIDGDAAARFAGTVYRELARGRLVDAAVAEARGMLMAGTDWEPSDAWLPSLTLSAFPDQVLPRRFAVDTHELPDIRSAYPYVHALVNRMDARRELMRALGEAPADTAGHGVVAVVGDASCGKTELVRWCLGTLALRGRNVAYVDLIDYGRLDPVELLELIAGALVAPGRHAAANRRALDATYLGGIEERRLSGTPRDAPEGSYRRALDPGERRAAFELFRAALARLAAERPVVIALDRFSTRHIESSHLDAYVLPELVTPIAEGNAPVRLVLATDPTSYKQMMHGRERLRQRIHKLALEAYPDDEYPELATQFLEARGIDPEQARRLVAFYRWGHKREAWTGERFSGLETQVRQFGWRAADSPW